MSSFPSSHISLAGLSILLWLSPFPTCRCDEIAVVSNSGSSSLSFLSIEEPGEGESPKPTLLWLAESEAFPLGVDAVRTPDGAVAVAASQIGFVSILDLQKQEARHVLSIGPNPTDDIATLDGAPGEPAGVAVTPSGSSALVTEVNEQGEVFLIDLESGHLMGAAALGDDPGPVDISANGQYAVVVDQADRPEGGTIYALDLAVFPAQGSICEALLPGVHEITDVAFLPEGRALVLGIGVLVLVDLGDCDGFQIMCRLESDHLDQSSNLCVSQDGRFAYVTHSPLSVGNGWVRRVSIGAAGTPCLSEDFESPFPAEVGRDPHGVSLSSDEKWVVVANSRSDSLTRVRIADGQKVELPVCGRVPREIAVVGNLDVPASTPAGCGDINDDGVVDVSDSVYLLNYLFKDGEPPPACRAACPPR